MALPAGRYGVTKNQLLKIKKLPMNTIKLIEDLYEKYSLLGSAAFKNSTSVVTESSDLVESGAVKELVGWGNKNLCDTSKTEIGVAWNGDSNANRARLIIPCDGNTTYTLSINGTSAIDLVYAQHTPTIPASNVGESFDTTLTITTSSNDAYIVVGFNKTAISMSDVEALKLQLEVGSTATAYEPYHASVSDSLDDKCDNSTIAPVENGSTASQAYAVGSHAIRNGAFITWKNAKAQGETINDASDYTSGDVADSLIKQATFSGTTSSTGNMLLDNTGRKILQVYCDRGYTIAEPYITSGNTYIRCIESTGTVYEGAISGTYYYI